MCTTHKQKTDHDTALFWKGGGGEGGGKRQPYSKAYDNDKQSTEKYVLFYSIIPITKAIFHQVSGDTIY